MKKYETILDQIAEMFKEQGHSFYKTSVVEDRIDFGMPKRQTTPSSAFDMNKNITPVDGKPLSSDKESAASEEGEAGKSFFHAPNKQRQVKLRPSSTIQSAAYWPTKEYLLVSFKSGATYSYEGVPEATIIFWQSASSAGSFFYYNIRMNYKYQKQG